MARTRRRKKRTQPETPAGDAPGGGVPQSFVLKRGRLAPLVDELASDLRKVMEPHTAVHLRERKQNKLKDFVHVAGPLGVSHFLLLSATERSRYLRIAKAPRGPTLTWRIAAYAHTAEVAASQARPRVPTSAFRSPPLVVLSNFGAAKEQRLCALTFQNLFPPLNVRTAKLADCQRVLLVDYDGGSGRFRVRHYAVGAVAQGVSRRLRRLLASRRVPDLGGCVDAADFFAAAGASDSEGGDAVGGGDAGDAGGDGGGGTVAAVPAPVRLPQPLRGAGNAAGAVSQLRLTELGPRLDLELIKVEEGLCSGAVLFHGHVTKTEAQREALDAAAQAKAEAKAARRSHQAANVERKRGEAGEREARREAARGARKEARAAAAAAGGGGGGGGGGGVPGGDGGAEAAPRPAKRQRTPAGA